MKMVVFLSKQFVNTKPWLMISFNVLFFVEHSSVITVWNGRNLVIDMPLQTAYGYKWNSTSRPEVWIQLELTRIKGLDFKQHLLLQKKPVALIQIPMTIDNVFVNAASRNKVIRFLATNVVRPVSKYLWAFNLYLEILSWAGVYLLLVGDSTVPGTKTLPLKRFVG